ncbi:hypothetical protein [Streptomyces xantholiticus]|uniref:Uncharacterized protein n=1 Tax=Streptomyces xantholiticus TaxID=68285 RepID=A0ABV1V4L3_9ACTN
MPARIAHLLGLVPVVDHEVAFIPRADQGAGVVVVQDLSTISYLCAVFEHSWVQAEKGCSRSRETFGYGVSVTPFRDARR